MLAKRFLYVCAGLLCLALAYHFGAQSATAQAGGMIDGAAMQYVPGLPAGWRASGVVGRTFYAVDGNGNRYVFTSNPIPGSARVIATDPGFFNVMLENGDVLQANGTDWRFVGNLLGGATSATQETWGGLKARYRPDAPTQDR